MTNDRKNTNALEISATSTSCQSCVFAIFDNKTQTGCFTEQIEKFRKSNVEVLEVFDDEDNEFFIIKDKLCSYYRPKRWIEKFLPDLSLEDISKDIKASLRIPYQTIIFFRDTDSIEDLDKRLVELQGQQVKPNIVTVIDRSHAASAEGRQGDLIKLFNNNYSFDYWRVQTAAAIDQYDLDLVDICYDNTKNYKFFFYSIFEASKPIPLDFSEAMHSSIQDQMIAFTVLTPNEDGVGGGALKAAHAKYGGNSFGIPLEEKIKHYDDSVHLIKKAEELCPSLQTS